jgi:hypothetical protein
VRNAGIALVKQRRIRFHLLQWHPCQAQIVEEGDAFNILLAVAAVSIGGAPNRSQQSNALVIAQRVGSKPGQLRHLLDGQRLFMVSEHSYLPSSALDRSSRDGRRKLRAT